MDNIINKIFKVIKEAKRKDIDPKLKAWIEAKYGPWDERDFLSDDGDTYFKTSSVNKETGAVEHTIINLPSFETLIKQLKATKDAANELIRGESVRDDEVLRSIYDEIRNEFNRFRTHLRKEYPAFYQQLKGQLSEELDEMSTTGGGTGAATFTPGTGMTYATPYAFKLKKKQEPIPESKISIKVGDILTKDGKKGKVVKVMDDMANVDFGNGDVYGITFSRIKGNKIVKENLKNYIKVSKPSFRKDKNNPNFLSGYIKYDTGGGSSIALGKETMSGQIRRLSSAEAVRQMDNIAKKLNDSFDIEDIEVTDLKNGVVELFAVSDDFIDMDPRSELSMALLDEGIGASLGPGPKASADGVNNSTYTSEFGYKLVPKNKAGNYVQKGSKLDVKQIFEDQKKYQNERIQAFDVIEQQLNDIYKMLSNAKNETSEYYNDNPSSYNVVKPTDLVLDYIKDIKDLLKGE